MNIYKMVVFVPYFWVGLGSPVFAQEEKVHRCIDVAVPKKAIESHTGGKWIQVTPEQWEFLRGIYAMNPQTPPGLPVGDKAFLAEATENDGALVFFVDGDKACTPMPVPKTLLNMLDDIATSKINHEGKGL